MLGTDPKLLGERSVVAKCLFGWFPRIRNFTILWVMAKKHTPQVDYVNLFDNTHAWVAPFLLVSMADSADS